MQETSTKRPGKAPRWVWAFVVACAAIPVLALGGAIPTMLGAAGAVTCYAFGRDGKGSAQRRVLLCSSVTVVAWAGFGLLFWIVASHADAPARGGTTRIRKVNGKIVSYERGAAKRTSIAELSEAERRAIYADATDRRAKIERKEAQIEARLRSGGSVAVLEKQLEAIESMHERHVRFVAKHNGLTPSQLDTIIDQGDEAGW